jgi:predicted CXXCH cytochrome family protein
VSTGSPRSLRVIVLLSALAIGALPLSSRAAVPPETIDPDASCADGECHTGIGEVPHVHWPDFTEPGECEACHEFEEDLHEFTLAEPPDLCTDCHEEIGELIQSGATVHDPAEDCTDCHDPHGGEVEALLVGVRDDDDLKPLCFECHDEDLIEGEYTHGPAEQGECNLCHDPHASSAPSLLLGEGIELCGDCHEEIAESIEESEYVHDPVEEGCVDCHNPHSGPYAKMLPAEKRQVCNECHDDIVAEAETAAVDHAPVVTEDECLGCHSPHASNNPANLVMAQRDLCVGCHNKPVESGDAVLIDMQGWLLENPTWHEPIREDNCAGCHQPHGSANFRLLKDSFPSTFYAAFDLDVYGLCFSCHESGAVTVQWTRTLTGFRDGNRNLHFLHVNKKTRGRTCRACHELHASPNPLHIREEVPYGKWMMPINFKQEDTGGSCHPGCHKIKVYDRKADDYSGN